MSIGETEDINELNREAGNSMENTAIKVFDNKPQLNEFLAENDVIDIQMQIASHVHESALRDAGVTTSNHMVWSVWYHKN